MNGSNMKSIKTVNSIFYTTIENPIFFDFFRDMI